MHRPVLFEELIAHLQIIPGGLYIDATAGEGGHLQGIVSKGGKVLGLDYDKTQIENLRNRFASNDQVVLKVGNFSQIFEIANENGFSHVDGIVFDLGLSMRQIQDDKKGFSFGKHEELLDMRVDEREEISASDILNKESEVEIYEILAKNAEEVYAEKIAHAIILYRREKEIKTVGELVQIINSAAPGSDSKTYARVFQALRMEVNHERENLMQGLTGASKLLKKDGRIAVITFHSVEDRIVKQFVNTSNLRFITKKPIRSSFGRSFERSAKLRIISLN